MAQAATASQRMSYAAREPSELHELLAWFRREWAKEMPSRIHGRGVEPDSALGSPCLSGAFRAYIDGSPMATDHDDALDTWKEGACRLRPIHAALSVMDHRWPLSSRYLFALAWSGAEWQDVALAWRLLPEIGHRFAQDALKHLWSIWEREQRRGYT